MSVDASIRKGGALDAALAARERARRARVQDHDAQIGGGALHAGAQLVVADAVAADQQAVLVGVARVVDEQLAAHAGGCAPARSRCSTSANAASNAARLAVDTNTMSSGATPPSALQHAAHGARVAGRVAQLRRASGRRRRRPRAARSGAGAPSDRRGARRGGGDAARWRPAARRSGTAGTAPRRGREADFGWSSELLLCGVRLVERERDLFEAGRQRQRLVARRRLSRERARGLAPRSRPRTASAARTRKKRSKAGASSSSYAEGRRISPGRLQRRGVAVVVSGQCSVTLRAPSIDSTRRSRRSRPA